MPAQILRVLFQTADDMIRALASWGADPSEADFEALQTQEWLHQMTAESVWFRARWVVPDSKDGRAALEVYTEPVGGGHRIPVRWFVKATRAGGLSATLRPRWTSAAGAFERRSCRRPSRLAR